jgi:hypothetical protein
MALIKSKINSLAWLKSAAICISVVGGVILSSKPASSASVTFDEDTSTSLVLVLSEDKFGGDDPDPYEGKNWRARFSITRGQGVFIDTLRVTATLLHKSAPHSGDNSLGEALNLIFIVNSSATATNNVIRVPDNDVSKHPPNHSDRASGILEAVVSYTFPRKSDIESWNLRLNANHNTQPVPEPLTILGTVAGLGCGALFKRKYSQKKKS